MNRDQAIILASHYTDIWWNVLKTAYPQIGARPRVEISNRLKTTAGYMYYEIRVMKLSLELFSEHTQEMVNETIPHELCHQVCWDIYAVGGHGTDWKGIMRKIGKEPARCHAMINTKHEARKAGVK